MSVTFRTAFKSSEVKSRTQGGRQLDYVAIDATINRVLDVLATRTSTGEPQGYTFHVVNYTMQPVDWRGKPQWAVSVHGRLTIDGFDHDGLGADISDDPDKALKTALAESYKKAGHQLGIGLELWDEGARALVAEGRAAASGDLTALKTQVFRRALSEGLTDHTAEGIAAHFGLTTVDLQDGAKLQALVADRL